MYIEAMDNSVSHLKAIWDASSYVQMSRKFGPYLRKSHVYWTVLSIGLYDVTYGMHNCKPNNNTDDIQTRNFNTFNILKMREKKFYMWHVYSLDYVLSFTRVTFFSPLKVRYVVRGKPNVAQNSETYFKSTFE